MPSVSTPKTELAVTAEAEIKALGNRLATGPFISDLYKTSVDTQVKNFGISQELLSEIKNGYKQAEQVGEEDKQLRLQAMRRHDVNVYMSAILNGLVMGKGLDYVMDNQERVVSSMVKLTERILIECGKMNK